MTLTPIQQVILYCLFIAPEDKKGFKKYQDCARVRANPEAQRKARESTRRYRETPQAREVEREYRKTYRENARENDRNRHAALRRKINLLKMERPCYDCGGVFPPNCMDWDHLPQFEKRFEIGPKIASRGFDAVIDEINKCQLVCSNCHRLRTEARKKGKVL